jgi:hypothetical protein
MDLPENVLHVGSKGAIVIEVECKVVEITEEFEEDIEELSVARHIDSLVDGGESSSGNAGGDLGDSAKCCRLCLACCLVLVEIIVLLAGKACKPITS